MPVIGYKGLIAYIQREIDRVLRLYHNFVRVYINNIMIAFKTLKEYIEYLYQVFSLFI